MDIENYFERPVPGDIRLKGTRIGIESVLYEYIYREQTPESILKSLPTLSLEQIYAVILYYLQNKDFISGYMEEWIEYGRRKREEQRREPSPVVLRLRQLKKERQKVESKAS